jgi:serine/threonine protein kinase
MGLARGTVAYEDIVFGDDIARGATAHVKKAKYKGVDVAAKIFYAAAGLDSGRFKREAEALMNVNHPNIIRAIGFCLPEPTHPAVLLMELARGNLKTVRLNPTQQAVVILQCLSAVAHLHELGFVHRDLKPTNILLDANCNAKLGDFGESSWRTRP